MYNWNDTEEKCYKLVTLTPMRKEEIVALLNRVIARVEAIPVSTVDPN